MLIRSNLSFLVAVSTLIILSILSKNVFANILPEQTDSSQPSDPRVVGGSAITIDRAPYQVSIRRKDNEKSKGYGWGHTCGGSVVSQRLIITAAHCVIDTSAKPPVHKKPRELTVVMGSNQLFSKDSNTLQYDVQEIIAHPKFNTTSLENDIAAMFINGYIPWNWPTVRAIPLNQLQLSRNTPCIVSGWGKLSNNLIPSTLNAATVPIVLSSECSKNYGTLPPDMLCAGYMNTGDVDACQGDSGGPLACGGVLGGVVSWGNGCGFVGYPGIYNNITYSNDWIRSVNSSFNYTHYGGGAFGIKGQSSMVILSTLFMMLLCGLMWKY